MSYQPGQRVRVAARSHDGHHRTPGYVKGRVGRVERAHGSFRNPETRAYGEDGRPERVLYQVSFDPRQLWPDDRFGARDRILLDIYEHWLENAD